LLAGEPLKRAWRIGLDAVTLGLGAGGVMAAPLFLIRHQPLRTFLPAHWWVVVVPAACYALAVSWAWWKGRRPAWRAAWDAARALLVLSGVAALAAMAASAQWPADALLGGVAAGALLAVVIAGLPQPFRVGAAAVSAALLAIVFLRLSAPVRPAVSIEDRTIHTRYGSLALRLHENYLPIGPTTGGGFATAGDRLFVMTGDGELAELTFDAGDRLAVRRLPIRVPVAGEFAARAARTGAVNAFRATGLLVMEQGADLRLYAMHHHWNDAERCFTMRISTTTRAADLAAGGPADWRTLYETRPCLKPTAAFARGFSIFESGGRLLAFDDEHLLVTVGDHEFDGVNNKPAQAQDPESDYGKTLLIHMSTGARRLFSRGHRNPQGLHRDRDGALWIAEHGPDGGDEINQLTEGANYGWPVVTYGTDYGEKIWPPNPHPGEHFEFTPPLFSWVPAIGVSNLIRISGAEFTNWDGDLLTATLRDATLRRLRVRDGRVIFDERIPIGRRVRDLRQISPDRIVLLTDDRAIVSVRPLRAGQREAEAFAPCAVCHPVADGRSHGIGPDLFGVYRRRAAEASGFDFSPGLKGSNIRGNQERLDEFIANPSSAVPGTTMDFEGITDPAQRELIINYLLQSR
jgi:cytochrome c2